MMPELGKYGAVVISAYGVSLLLLALLVALTLWRCVRVRDTLRRAEAARKRADG